MNKRLIPYEPVVDQVFKAMETLGINWMPNEEELSSVYGPLFISILDAYGGLEYMKENYKIYSKSEYIGAVVRGKKKIGDAKDLVARKQLRKLINEYGVIKLRNMIYQEDSKMEVEKMGIYDMEVI